MRTIMEIVNILESEVQVMQECRNQLLDKIADDHAKVARYNDEIVAVLEWLRDIRECKKPSKALKEVFNTELRERWRRIGKKN